MDGKYDLTFCKNMKTEVLPSYQAAQTIKVREICIIWCPTSIENSTFYKKCVFYINQDAPRLFARNFQQFACFCHNLHTSSRCQCILWFSMVLKGSITLHYGTELESFLKVRSNWGILNRTRRQSQLNRGNSMDQRQTTVSDWGLCQAGRPWNALRSDCKAWYTWNRDEKGLPDAPWALIF